ncbi:MAG: aminotransferase class IV [Chthoniobacterales bacterium]|nr:aminotransferase class IV [Chthoniobacterales bacterium]
MSPPAVRSWLWEGGAWIPSAALPVTDRSVRYGMAIFETVGIRRGTPLFLPRHLSLLGNGVRQFFGTAAVPAFRGIPPLDPSDTGVLRLYVTAGDGSPGAPVTAPRNFALFEAVSTSRMPKTQTARMHPEPAAPFGHGRKTANYWMNCAAQSAAQSAGFDHALLADHDGFVLSAAFGNLFFVLGDKLCTPSLSLPVRPGVIRSWVVSRKDVKEVKWPADRLGEVSELFLTNSRLGIMPLRFGTIAPGPVGRALREAGRREKITP